MMPAAMQRGAIRLNLVLPVTRVQVAGLTVDPVAGYLGAPLSQLLAPVMTGPPILRPGSGRPVEVYPLALPEGEGAELPLGSWGELAFANVQGLLELVVPWPAVAWVQQRFGPAVVVGPEPRRSRDGRAQVARFGVRLQPGMRTSLPLGKLGEVGVEAV